MDSHKFPTLCPFLLELHDLNGSLRCLVLPGNLVKTGHGRASETAMESCTYMESPSRACDLRESSSMDNKRILHMTSHPGNKKRRTSIYEYTLYTSKQCSNELSRGDSRLFLINPTAPPRELTSPLSRRPSLAGPRGRGLERVTRGPRTDPVGVRRVGGTVVTVAGHLMASSS